MPTQIQLRRGNTSQHSAFTGAVGEITVDTDKNTLLIHDGVTVGGHPLSSEMYSGLAYNAANAAYTLANAAFSMQNLDFTLSNSAFAHANSAYDTSNLAYASVNSNWTVQNNIYLTANASFDTTNSAYHTTNAAYASANSNWQVQNNIYLTANALFDGLNSSWTRQNAIYALANSVYDSSNSNWTVQNLAYSTTNAAYTLANAAYDTTNAAFAHANSVSIGANAHATSVGASANSFADATYVKLTAAQQTITGDLSITGNLTFLGNSTIVSSNNLVVGDSMIYLAANNYSGTDLLDIGFIGNYGNTTGANVHTGLVRDATTKQYYLFNGLDVELFDNNQSFEPYANGAYNAILNADINAGNVVVSGTNVYSWIVAAYTTANSSNGYADQVGLAGNNYTNSVGLAGNAYADYVGYSANTASYPRFTLLNGRSNGIYDLTNSSFNTANSAYFVANGAYEFANSLSALEAISFGTANIAYNAANAAFALANTISPLVYSGYTTTNSAYHTANLAYTATNNAYNTANASFDKANNALANTSGVTFAGDLRVTGQLYVGTNTVTINDSSIVAASIAAGSLSVNGSALPSGLTFDLSFNTANSAYNTANAAFGAANNVAPQIAPAYDTANAAFAAANNVAPQIAPAYDTANAAFAAANNVAPQIAPAFNTANAAFAAANNVAPQIAPAYETANAAFGAANLVSGYAFTNSEPRLVSAFNTANAAYNSANNVAPQIAPAFNTANAAFAAANNVAPQIAPAFNTANAAFAAANNVAPQIAPAFNTANAAFATANAALPNTTGAVFNGNLTVSGNVNVTSLLANTHIDFTTLPYNSPLVPYREGRLWYNNDAQTLQLESDNSDFPIPMGEREWVRCRNNSGVTIYKGQPVYVTGVHMAGHPVHGHHPTIALADASDPTKREVIGLAGHDISDQSHGYVVVRGWIGGVDTSALTSGSRVHLGYAAPGTLITAAPEYPNWPMDVGICLTSGNNSVGTLYVQIYDHSLESLRVVGPARVGGDMTVEGDFTVLGTQTVTNMTSASLGTQYIYLAESDSIPNANITFSGSGLNDLDFTGHYQGVGTTNFYVKITGSNTTGDYFSWSYDDFATTEVANTLIAYQTPQYLSNGISTYFYSATGHTTGNKWNAAAIAITTDSGLVTNHTDPGRYTHAGMFRDATDGTFRFFNTYDPEPVGNINITNNSFTLANVEVLKITAEQIFAGTTEIGGLTKSSSIATNAAYSVANTARDTASASYNTANAAFAAANNVAPQIAPAFNTANAAFAAANNVAPQIAPAFNTANAAFAAANNVAPQIAPAFNTANAAYGQTNTNTTTLTAAYGTVNTNSATITAAYGQTNTNTTTLTAAYGQVNTNAATLTAAYASINSNWSVTNTAYAVANAAFAKANTSGGGSSVNVGQTTPSTSSVGSLWWNSDLGKLFIYYTDPANTSSWIEASPSASSIEGALVTGYINPIYTIANNAYLAANNASNAGNNIGVVYNTANAAFAKANSALANGTAVVAGSLSLSSAYNNGNLYAANGAGDLAIGTHATYGSSFAAVWKSGYDYSLLTNGTDTFVNSPNASGTVWFRRNNTNTGSINSAGMVVTGNSTIGGTQTVASNMNIGGTSLSTYRLDVTGTARATSDFRSPIFYDSDDTTYYINLNGSSQVGGHFRIGPYAGSATSGNVTGLEIMNNGGTGDSNLAAISFHCQGNYGAHMHLRADSYFGIGGWSASSWRWYVALSSGDMTAAGNVTAYSDPRLKEDITPIESPLDKIRQLNGVRFRWKDLDILGHAGEYDYGILADEVEKVAPEIVAESAHDAPEGDKYKTVAYDKLVPFLIEAIKELQDQIDELKGNKK